MTSLFAPDDDADQALADLSVDGEQQHLQANEIGRGESIVQHGVATLGPLTIDCDGEIDGQIWGAGHALASYLLFGGGGAELFKDSWPCVVEVGAGTGIAGLAAAASGASSVVLTDLPKCVARLEAAIERNAGAFAETGCVVEAAPLAWGDADQARAALGPDCEADVVIAADVTYSANSLAELVATLEALAAPNGAPVYVAAEKRWPELEALWATALAASRMSVVGTRDLPRSAKLPRTVVLQELRFDASAVS